MDAAGVIAAYVLDGDRPLTATSNNNTTFYLYGLGAIGEKTSAWSYSLPDGTNTPRQLSDLSGDITLSARYTPWGDTFDTIGAGNFSPRARASRTPYIILTYPHHIVPIINFGRYCNASAKCAD